MHCHSQPPVRGAPNVRHSKIKSRSFQGQSWMQSLHEFTIRHTEVFEFFYANVYDTRTGWQTPTAHNMKLSYRWQTARLCTPPRAVLWWMTAINWPDFPTFPLLLDVLNKGNPLELSGIGYGKTRMAGLQSGEGRMMIDSVVWPQYVNVTDTQPRRHSKYRTTHCVERQNSISKRNRETRANVGTLSFWYAVTAINCVSANTKVLKPPPPSSVDDVVDDVLFTSRDSRT